MEYLFFFPGKGVLELCGVLLSVILCKRSMPNDVSYAIMICLSIQFVLVYM